MRKQPFYFEIKDVMTQFLAAFNDIIINRHTRDRGVRSKVKVRYVYAPKQRVIHDLTNKARHITLPVVAVSIAGVSRDEGRVFNKLEGAYFPGAENNGNMTVDQEALTTYHVPQPVPVDISVNMSIMARYQTDIEQIISNFVPYNDPYVVISWKLPENFTKREQEIRSEVMWDGNLNITYPDQLSGTEPYRLSCDTSFTIKSWLFKEITDPQKNITRVTYNMTPENEFDMDLPVYDEVTESSYINAMGPTLTASPIVTHGFDVMSVKLSPENSEMYVVEADGTTQELWGYNFGNVTAAYLSGTELNAVSGDLVNNFTSDDYPAFTGVPIDFNIINDNKLTIELPAGMEVDKHTDVILVNIAGYGTSITSPLHRKGLFS